MIKEKEGNLLESDCTAIFHQTNCLGIMGGGIAHQIQKKWFGSVFVYYERLCYLNAKNHSSLLGTIQPLKTNTTPIEYVINLFSQDNISETKSEFEDGRQTDYDAMKEGLTKIKEWCYENKVFKIGCPKLIGCGLAGGDWNIVLPMLKEIFEDDKKITLFIYDFNTKKN